MNKKGVVKDKRITIDIMHYKNNSISFWLILLAIALNVAMFIIIYRANTSDLAADLQLGIDLIINVVMMLACFLAAEKTKRYSKEWGIGSIVLGGIQVARIFWIPLYYYLNGGITAGLFSACLILLAICAAALIFAGVITLIKYNILQANKPLIVTGGIDKKGKSAPKFSKRIPFKDITYEKKKSIDPSFDEFVVTFIYKKKVIPYYIFFTKSEHASLMDAKRYFYQAVNDHKVKKYARAFILRYKNVLKTTEPKIEGVKKDARA